MRFVIIASISAIAALAASPNFAAQMVSIEGQDFRSRATTMNEMLRQLCFLLLVTEIWFVVLVSGPVGYAAEKKSGELPASDLIASSEDHPNPHNPFWITTRTLGFATEQEAKSKLVGAVFAIDLQTKKLKKLLDRDAFDASFLRKLNRLSFVAVGKHQQVTLFTKSI